MVDKRIGVVITRWKYSNTLQVFSNIMTKGVVQVTRKKGRDLITVKSSKDINSCQKLMGQFDPGDQHMLINLGFTNVAHFKKGYKKSFWGLNDFGFLQIF